MADVLLTSTEEIIQLVSVSGASQGDIASAVSSHNALATAHIAELITYNAACDWYVDSVNGSDSNTGLAPNIAFATIAKVMTVLTAGDVIGLVRGSTWHEQLTIAVNNVKVIAVGNGLPPVFEGADVVANASFTKTGGYTNIYQVTVTTNYTASEPQFVRVWEDSVGLPITATLAALDTTPRAYFVATHDAVSVTVYVHASSSADITANGRLYEISKRTSGVYSFFASGTVVDGVTCRRPCGNGGAIKVGAFSTVANCISEDGNKHNFYARRGTNYYNCLARDAYFNDQATAFVLNDDTPNGETSNYDSCVVLMPLYTSYMTGFYGHHNVSGSFGKVTYSNCKTTNCASGWALSDATSAEYRNCYGTNNRYDFALTNAGTFSIIGGEYISIYAGSAMINNTVNACTIIVSSVLSDKSDLQNGHVFSGVASTVSIVNCKFIARKTNATFQIGTYMSVTGGSLYLRNNRYEAPNLAAGPYFIFCASTTTLDSDYNSFARANMYANVNGGNYATIADYQTATGQDAHSVIAA